MTSAELRLLGARFRAERRARRESIKTLAAASGLHRNTVSRLEKGLCANPRESTLGMLAAALGRKD